MQDLKAFLPEALYESSISLSEIELFSSVSGIAIRFDSHNREILVSLGNNVFGIIPEDEATIYDFTFPEGKIIPYQIFSIIGKKIRAVVIGIRNDGLVILSRKRSMLQAWNALFEGKIVNALILKIIPTGIFVDLGNGLTSFVHVIDCSNSHYDNLNIWFKVDSCTPVKIIVKSKDNYFILASRKEAFPSYNDAKNLVFKDDIITVRITGRPESLKDGYFCEFTPRIVGIIDTLNTYNEGDLVKGYVKKITQKGLKLNLIE